MGVSIHRPVSISDLSLLGYIIICILEHFFSPQIKNKREACVQDQISESSVQASISGNTEVSVGVCVGSTPSEEDAPPSSMFLSKLLLQQQKETWAICFL